MMSQWRSNSKIMGEDQVITLKKKLGLSIIKGNIYHNN